MSGWAVTASGTGVSGTANLVFNGNGKVATGGTSTLNITLSNGATTPMNVSLDLSR